MTGSIHAAGQHSGLDKHNTHPSSEDDGGLETRMAVWKEELRFDNLVSVHELSYKRAGHLLTTKTEECPSHDWIVTIDPETKDVHIRIAKDEEAMVEYFDNKLNQVSTTNFIRTSIEKSAQRVSCTWKLNSGRPTGETEVALLVLYLFATRQCKSIEVSNFGTASEPKYDISKARCTGGELSQTEKSFFDKINKSEGAICFESTSLESYKLYSVSN
ncbi:hypothetical protein EJ05DRAFT_9160 [Pseudovirgaria hyperparasitica]|uniref:Uncharacterized protein n=1 Tax=Pseudovirgaria hyperparasitica TaxID=470096 RepID=A0A6A6WKJ1_9PEZI|nr:uncharacterized protein EJ05DRAFT_9160 [Pseudovirgaria hyperparasitica]KAF2762682.1 hypothetical protein EJ05DRAFT_9160 [Pseudovirgaria hyperparasitica]